MKKHDKLKMLINEQKEILTKIEEFTKCEPPNTFNESLKMAIEAVELALNFKNIEIQKCIVIAQKETINFEKGCIIGEIGDEIVKPQ